jgi:hypothetical protein
LCRFCSESGTEPFKISFMLSPIEYFKNSTGLDESDIKEWKVGECFDLIKEYSEYVHKCEHDEMKSNYQQWLSEQKLNQFSLKKASEDPDDKDYHSAKEETFMFIINHLKNL